MKKDRLLEIIREEISAALTESETIDLPGDPNKLNPKAKESAIKQARTMSKDMTIGTPKNPVEFVEEEQLNEMAWDIVIAQPDKLSKLQDKLKDSTKKGEQKLAKALEIIQNTKKEGKPIRQRDIANEMGLIQQQINPLINQLIDVGILEKGESVKGVTKKKITDKPQGKPAKAAVAPKAEPMDDEDAEATKAAGSDEMAQKLASTPDSKKETFNKILNLVTKYKDDKAKVDAFITKAEKEYKLPSSLVKDLKRAAGREVEA
jgi:DNA-binding MarR family transcriptional regulator